MVSLNLSLIGLVQKVFVENIAFYSAFGSILVGLISLSLLIPFDLFNLKNRAYVYLTNSELSYFSISFTVLLFSGFAFFLNQAFKRIADQLADYHRLSFCFFILVVF